MTVNRSPLSKHRERVAGKTLCCFVTLACWLLVFSGWLLVDTRPYLAYFAPRIYLKPEALAAPAPSPAPPSETPTASPSSSAPTAAAAGVIAPDAKTKDASQNKAKNSSTTESNAAKKTK